jgi:hypothetical protein
LNLKAIEKIENKIKQTIHCGSLIIKNEVLFNSKNLRDIFCCILSTFRLRKFFFQKFIFFRSEVLAQLLSPVIIGLLAASALNASTDYSAVSAIENISSISLR